MPKEMIMLSMTTDPSGMEMITDHHTPTMACTNTTPTPMVMMDGITMEIQTHTAVDDDIGPLIRDMEEDEP